MTLAELEQKVKDALADNTGFTEQVKVTLLVVWEQITALKTLDGYYTEQIKEFVKLNEKAAELSEQIEKLVLTAEELFARLDTAADEKKAEIQAFVDDLKPIFETLKTQTQEFIENLATSTKTDIENTATSTKTALDKYAEQLKKDFAADGGGITNALSANKTYYVGTSKRADFATINEALAQASRFVMVVSEGLTYKINILLEQDFVWAETLNLKNIKLDQISLGMKANSKGKEYEATKSYNEGDVLWNETESGIYYVALSGFTATNWASDKANYLIVFDTTTAKAYTTGETYTMNEIISNGENYYIVTNKSITASDFDTDSVAFKIIDDKVKDLQPIQVKLSALKPFELHGSKYTSLICLDNASLSIDSLDLQVMGEADLGEAAEGTIELIKLCDNSTLYAKSFTLDSCKISAATSDYKVLYMLTNSVFFGDSLSLTFDNTLKVSQPAVWIKDKSSVSFDSITINGSEPDALVKQKDYRLYGVIVTNQSIFYSANTMTIKALNYGIRLEYSTIGFEIYEHSNALVSIAANVSTIARGNMSITQQLTADDNATQTALELTNSTLKAINITFSGIGFIDSTDSEIDVFGFVNLTSTQPQANVTNTWKCEIKGGSCNINTLKYVPQVTGTNDFISYPKLTAASEYSGLVNAGEGVNFKVLFVDIQNITLQWLQLSGETQAANPKGLFSFGGGRFLVRHCQKISNISGFYIDELGTQSEYTFKIYANCALPDMLSQISLGDFKNSSQETSNLASTNLTTQLSTGTLAISSVDNLQTLSLSESDNSILTGCWNETKIWELAGTKAWAECGTGIRWMFGVSRDKNNRKAAIVRATIYANFDLTGADISIEGATAMNSLLCCGGHYNTTLTPTPAYKIDGNKIHITIRGGGTIYCCSVQGSMQYRAITIKATKNSQTTNAVTLYYGVNYPSADITIDDVEVVKA